MSEKKVIIEQPVYDLAKFQIAEILSNNIRSKTIALLGKFSDSSGLEKAVVILEKTAFVTDTADVSTAAYFSVETNFKVEFINNIYGNFQGFPPSNLNSIKITVIFPATEKHIAKYSATEKILILETPKLYEHVMKPYINSSQFSLQWVYNILEHKEEQDRIIFEDNHPQNGFILLPDLKWDGHTVDSFYVLAIVHDKEIKSLRDLNEKHIPLLKSIRDKGFNAIDKKFSIKSSHLRAYIHYHPSFYHFHVHFNTLNNDVPGTSCEKSHLLDSVINNIELMSDYYQKAHLPFVLQDDTVLNLISKHEQTNILN